MDAQSVLAGLKQPKKGKSGKHKSRKVGRNYRWAGTTHSVTKYRARHNIGPGPR